MNAELKQKIKDLLIVISLFVGYCIVSSMEYQTLIRFN